MNNVSEVVDCNVLYAIISRFYPFSDGTCSPQYSVKPCYTKSIPWPRNALVTGKISRNTFEKVEVFQIVENINL